MARLASGLNNLFEGKLKPAHITTLSFLGHIPAAWALWSNRPIMASIYIVVFGLMDLLDGALARVQKSNSKLGIFYDATTDRLKEILIYAALAVFVSKNYAGDVSVWAVPAVVGSSLLVSYVKAKGESAISHESHDKMLLNQAFSQGIARYEIRMTLLVVGLITGLLPALLNLIIALNLITASMRFIEVSKLLSDEDRATDVKITKKTIKSDN